MAKTFILLTLILLIIPSLITSLATVSISHINSNQTLICALTKSHAQQQQQNNLNCTITNPPANFQLPSTGNTRVSYAGIAGGNNFLCALSSPFLNASGIRTSFLVCWRFDAYGNSVFRRIYLGPSLKEIDSSDSHVCGIVDATNELLCWPQWNGSNHLGSRFSSNVAVDENYVCGLSETGQIKCLPRNNSNSNSNSNNVTVPTGTYSHISAGYNRACAISSSSGLDCWGDTMLWKPNGMFNSVSMGDNRYCAIRINGTVVCWGENDFSLPEKLQNVSFEGLQVSRGVFCGVSTANYSLYCWGNESLDLSLSSNSIVFSDVIPGLCTSSCACGPIQNYGTFCGGELMICKPGVCNQAPSQSIPPPQSVPPFVAPPQNDDGWSRKMIAFVVVGSVGSLSFILVLLFLFFRCCKSSEGSRVHDSGPMEDTQIMSQIRASNRVLVKKLSHLISMGTGNPLEEFALQTILDATDNFSDDHRIGVGSFGSVYRGLLTNGRKVAVKRAELSSSSSGPSCLKKRQEDTNNAFVSELEFLSRVNHKNLVQLLGFCEEETELVLVYEFMENGSLHDHLHNLFSSYIMSWPARIKVALDAARGLEYLHVYADPPIIHRDIKSSNILLDEEWNGKVSDFGLSLMGPRDDESHLSLHAAGTVGYMDPEYYKFEQLTSKSDVYSFGVVLLELLSGHRAIEKNEEGERRNVVQSVVPYIENEQIHRILDHKVPPPTPFEIESVKYVGYLAADCVTLEGRDRPTMSELVECLERAYEACFTIPSFSPSSSSSSDGITRVSV